MEFRTEKLNLSSSMVASSFILTSSSRFFCFRTFSGSRRRRSLRDVLHRFSSRQTLRELNLRWDQRSLPYCLGTLTHSCGFHGKRHTKQTSTHGPDVASDSTWNPKGCFHPFSLPPPPPLPSPQSKKPQNASLGQTQTDYISHHPLGHLEVSSKLRRNKEAEGLTHIPDRSCPFINLTCFHLMLFTRFLLMKSAHLFYFIWNVLPFKGLEILFSFQSGSLVIVILWLFQCKQSWVE